MSQQLTQIISPIVESLGYELWLVEIVGKKPSEILRIYIDSPQGVDIEDCEKVSHEVDTVLDVMANQGEISADHAQLEVSSPGLDRPLRTLSHFARFVGECAKVTLFAPVDGRRRLKGTIQSVNDQTITVEVDGESFTFSIADVAKAKLIPVF